jgi:hypothetical protein
MPRNTARFGDAVASQASFVLCDANVPAATVGSLARLAASAGCGFGPAGSGGIRTGPPSPPVPFLFEPISIAKCVKIAEADALHLATVVKPNRHEVTALANAVRTRLGLPLIPTAEEVAAAKAKSRAKARAEAAAAPASGKGKGQNKRAEGPALAHNRRVLVRTGLLRFARREVASALRRLEERVITPSALFAITCPL